MNWSLLAPLLVTAFVAIFGWLVVHRLSAARDRANKRRDLRVQYLIDAYRRLENAGNRNSRTADYSTALESAVADIQLFGSPAQVKLARQFALDFADNGVATLDPLLDNLRNDLRAELRLHRIDESITYLRITNGNRNSTVT